MSNKEIPKGKNHPLAHDAFAYIKDWMINNPLELMTFKESLASTAISGNEAAEYCLGTLDRILEGKPVGERYVFGLAWMIRNLNEKK